MPVFASTALIVVLENPALSLSKSTSMLCDLPVRRHQMNWDRVTRGCTLTWPLLATLTQHGALNAGIPLGGARIFVR
jgi:hypothetical protein